MQKSQVAFTKMAVAASVFATGCGRNSDSKVEKSDLGANVELAEVPSLNESFSQAPVRSFQFSYGTPLTISTGTEDINISIDSQSTEVRVLASCLCYMNKELGFSIEFTASNISNHRISADGLIVKLAPPFGKKFFANSEEQTIELSDKSIKDFTVDIISAYVEQVSGNDTDELRLISTLKFEGSSGLLKAAVLGDLDSIQKAEKLEEGFLKHIERDTSRFLEVIDSDRRPANLERSDLDYVLCLVNSITTTAITNEFRVRREDDQAKINVEVLKEILNRVIDRVKNKEII